MTIEPRGPKTSAGRQYQVRFTLEIEAASEKAGALVLANEAMAPLAAQPGAECAFGELAIKTKTNVDRSARRRCRRRRPESMVQALRASLSAGGYSVDDHRAARMRRVPRQRHGAVEPDGDAADRLARRRTICGKHQYKSCGSCGSVYVMSSTNASGPAPSLHCEVCNGDDGGVGRDEDVVRRARHPARRAG